MYVGAQVDDEGAAKGAKVCLPGPNDVKAERHLPPRQTQAQRRLQEDAEIYVVVELLGIPEDEQEGLLVAERDFRDQSPQRCGAQCR